MKKSMPLLLCGVILSISACTNSNINTLHTSTRSELKVTKGLIACLRHKSENECVRKFHVDTNFENQYILGSLYFDGREYNSVNKSNHHVYSFIRDYRKAEYWLNKSARNGNAKAQYKLGSMAYSGFWLHQSYANALYWFSKSAKQGNANAELHLGAMYDLAQGVKQDYKKAFDLYTKSANQGHYNAQYNLGVLYYAGNGVKQDYKKALYWYTKSANQGYKSALYNLAMMYERGNGTKKDYKKALDLYIKASKKGSSDAQLNLGAMYYLGKETEKNIEQAVYWTLKSAQQNSKSAQHNLGVMYRELNDQKIKAYAWALIGVKNGSKDDNLKEVRDLMSKSDIKKGKALAKELIKTIHK